MLAPSGLTVIVVIGIARPSACWPVQRLASGVA
jgi:hypothetical protein